MTELVEHDRPKFVLSKCVSCGEPAVRRVSRDGVNEFFWLCDRDECFDDLEDALEEQ